jgi:N utilization substance protein A
MSREILLLVDALANEKNVGREIVFESLEMALEQATKKRADNEDEENIEVRVSIDRETGDYSTFRKWVVVENNNYRNVDTDLTLEMALKRDSNAVIGQVFEDPMETVEFGRVGAQAAKQVILQKIRDAERDQLLSDFLDRKEDFIAGTVKRMERGSAIVEVGRVEAVLPRDQIIPKENLRVGDRIKAYLWKVDRVTKGPGLILSRTAKEFLEKLFSLEVPEIADGSIEIKAIARDAGFRAKMAVKSNDARIDPQGTCIGVRGSRVQSVSQELSGERVDIILWSPDPAQFVINALSPAQVARILVDEDVHAMDVIVEEDQLALAIGRNGQNVKLASELTGWQLNIMTVATADAQHEVEDNRVRALFVEQLSVDEDMASVLVQEGFTSLEEVAYVPINEMLDIEGFNEALVNELRDRARNALLVLAISSEEKMETVEEGLRNLEGLSDDLIEKLVQHNITTLDDFADLGTDDLIEMTGLSDATARVLIMRAREHWFNEE